MPGACSASKTCCRRKTDADRQMDSASADRRRDDAQPHLHRVPNHGIEIAVWEWNPRLRGHAPTFVLTHATGFHGRCWDAIVRRLGHVHVLAVDQRGHGRSSKTRFSSWADFGIDLAEVLVALDVHDAIGVGHSMGGHATVDAATLQPQCLRRLVLIDPVIASPQRYAGARLGTIDFDGTQHPTARRHNRFPTVAAMRARFADRLPFAGFHPEVMEDYCTYGLLPADDGDGLVLACPPWFEAAIYGSARSNPDVLAHAATLPQAVTVVRAQEPSTPAETMDFQFSPTWPALASTLRHSTDLYFPDKTHFLPMEDPQLVADILREAEQG